MSGIHYSIIIEEIVAKKPETYEMYTMELVGGGGGQYVYTFLRVNNVSLM